MSPFIIPLLQRLQNTSTEVIETQEERGKHVATVQLQLMRASRASWIDCHAMIHAMIDEMYAANAGNPVENAILLMPEASPSDSSSTSISSARTPRHSPSPHAAAPTICHRPPSISPL